MLCFNFVVQSSKLDRYRTKDELQRGYILTIMMLCLAALGIALAEEGVYNCQGGILTLIIVQTPE